MANTPKNSDSKVTSLDDDIAPANEAQAAADERVVTGANHDDQLSGKRVKINIQQSEGDGGSDAVFVSVNGYAYQIPRGIWCSVPVEVEEALTNAVQAKYRTEGKTVIETQVPRYGFSSRA